jgi:hypothetical protein
MRRPYSTLHDKYDVNDEDYFQAQLNSIIYEEDEIGNIDEINDDAKLLQQAIQESLLTVKETITETKIRNLSDELAIFQADRLRAVKERDIERHNQNHFLYNDIIMKIVLNYLPSLETLVNLFMTSKLLKHVMKKVLVENEMSSVFIEHPRWLFSENIHDESIANFIMKKAKMIRIEAFSPDFMQYTRNHGIEKIMPHPKVTTIILCVRDVKHLSMIDQLRLNSYDHIHVYYYPTIEIIYTLYDYYVDYTCVAIQKLIKSMVGSNRFLEIWTNIKFYNDPRQTLFNQHTNFDKKVMSIC